MDNHWVQIRAGRSNTKMVGMARANFPQVPEFPATGASRSPSPSLKTMIAKTIFAISNEESRYTLNGALLVLKAESMAMVATDGHRLAHIEKLGETLEGISGEKKTLIPRKALSELLVAAHHHRGRTRRVRRRRPDALLPRRRPRPDQPQAHRPVPQLRGRAAARQQQVRHRPQRRPDGRHPARRAVRRRALRRHQDPPRTERAQALRSSTDSGESEDTIETPYNYDPLVVGFNSQYLIDFLKAIGNTGEVRLEFKDAQSAGQMRPEDANEDVQVPLHPHAHAHLRRSAPLIFWTGTSAKQKARH